MNSAAKHLKRDFTKQSNPALDMVAPLAAALGTNTPLSLRPKDKLLIEDVETFHFGPYGSRQAWTIGSGPLVILVHGYSGRGVQMAKLAKEISTKGFQCVFFDAGGHGTSSEEKIGFHTFMNDTRDLAKHLDSQIHTLVGHSAGALAMMRARSIFNISAGRYCVISAPFFPYVPLNVMRDTGAPSHSLDYVKAILSDQFQMSWSSLVAGECFTAEQGKPLLCIYDVSDKKVRHTDADALGEVWPEAKIVKTKSYGHNRILQAEETLEAVLQFVAS